MQGKKLRPSGRLQARDRRRAAIHEASHIVVAAHYGCEVWGGIFEHPEATDDDLTTWVGKTTFNREAITSDGAFNIGVAGCLAECINDDLYWDSQDPYVLRFELIEGMSPTDRALARIDELPEDDDDPFFLALADKVELAHSLVRRLWPEIWGMSRQLIEEHKMISHSD